MCFCRLVLEQVTTCPITHTGKTKQVAVVPCVRTMRGPNVIYVGNLPNDIKERELQELFEKVSSAHGTAAQAAYELKHMCSCRIDERSSV